MTTVLTLAGIFLDPSELLLQLRGEVVAGNIVVPVYYANSGATEANILSGVIDLDLAVNSIAGPKVVFGHSLGAVVATRWLNVHGPTSSVPPSELSFVLIGNPARRYGGVLEFLGDVSEVLGLNWEWLSLVGETPVPVDTPYTVLDFARQYDGFADWPDIDNPNYLAAAALALTGMFLVHVSYITQSISSPDNQSFVEGNVTYMTSPTFPWWQSTQPPDWVTTTPSDSGVHTVPGNTSGVELPGQQQLLDLRGRLWETIFQKLVEAIFGSFAPGAGTAFAQVVNWINTLPFLSDLENAFNDILQIIIGGFTGIPVEEIELGVVFPHRFPTNFASVTTTTGGLFPLLQQILGLFGGANTLQQVINFFNNLIAQLGWPSLNNSTEDFDPSQALIDWLEILLDPLGLLFSQSQLTGADNDAFWSGAWPFDWVTDTLTPLQQFVENLSRLVPGINEFLNFDTNDTSTAFSLEKLIQTGVIAPLVDGILSDLHAPQVVQDIINSAIAAFNGVVGETFGDAEDFFLSLLGIHGTGTVAQSSADIANARNIIQDALLLAQEVINGGGAGSGTSFGSSFDGAFSTTLPGFTQRYRQNNGGTCGLDGEGNAVWQEDGSGVSECINRFSTSTTTDTQSVFFIIEDGVPPAGPGFETSPNALSLIGRANAASDSYVVATLYETTAEIGYVVSDVYTRLGATVGITHRAGDAWELRLGTLASSRQFLLLKNGLTKINRTDGGAVSQLGASNRYTGFIDLAGQAFFWLFFQSSPGVVQSWSAADRVAT